MSGGKGRILSSDQILSQVWDLDGDFVCANTVSVTINRLRKKIEPDGKTKSDTENLSFLEVYF
ncbi:MAG: winged helix-turn-helix domain-containing protein [Lachnospiraceae bacterium]|nr:winged helix-turn-helix domain-containing protein [Lachnospiraceae bacterium]